MQLKLRYFTKNSPHTLHACALVQLECLRIWIRDILKKQKNVSNSATYTNLQTFHNVLKSKVVFFQPIDTKQWLKQVLFWQWLSTSTPKINISILLFDVKENYHIWVHIIDWFRGGASNILCFCAVLSYELATHLNLLKRS